MTVHQRGDIAHGLWCFGNGQGAAHVVTLDSITVSPTPAAIAEYFKDAKKPPDARVTLGEQHNRVYGDVAISTGYYTFTDTRDGKSVTNAARDTFVYRYRDRNWLIVDHHSSRVP